MEYITVCMIAVTVCAALPSVSRIWSAADIVSADLVNYYFCRVLSTSYVTPVHSIRVSHVMPTSYGFHSTSVGAFLHHMFALKNIGIYARTAAQGAKASARFNSTQRTMNWVEFFKLKKQNTRVNVASSCFTGFLGAFATLTYLGNVEIDVEKPIMGLDPFMVMGGTVILGGVAGYLVGPSLGNVVFKFMNRTLLKQFDAKDQVFLQRIKHNRVDPSSQSFSNPVPDYYGERIYSLENYKQWLRDCNAFRRKSKEFL